MCGRYTIFTDPERLAERFDAALPAQDLRPRYNAAPTQHLPVILNGGPRHIELLQWGLIPFWAKDPTIGSRMINARVETVAEKPAFRAAFKKRRCLVLANGFYEWQAQAADPATGSRASKTPMRFALPDDAPFAFAGLWENWDAPDGSLLRTFTIITGPPNSLTEPVHNRMPAILLPEHEAIWLDDEAEPAIWLDILRPYPPERMRVYPVSRRVNTVSNDDPALVLPA